MKNIKIITALLIMLAGNAALFSSNASAYVYVNGYLKSNGTYVAPHYRSSPNSYRYDNFSSRGNVNPYTGKKGYKSHEYSLPRGYTGSSSSTSPFSTKYKHYRY